MTMRILTIDNDNSHRAAAALLQQGGFSVEVASCGEQGIDLAKTHDFDIVVANQLLPDMSGFEVIRRLRASKVATPIMLLALDESVEPKVRALSLGADDALARPYHHEELFARLRAIARRSRANPQSRITTGRLSVNLAQQLVEVEGRTVDLTKKEYKVIELLSLRRGATLNKDAILTYLYNGIDEPEHKIIDVFICKLRRKLADATDGENYIQTVRGRGYTLCEPGVELREAA
jgi:two-component system cell cycle response regulator CtrA